MDPALFGGSLTACNSGGRLEGMEVGVAIFVEAGGTGGEDIGIVIWEGIVLGSKLSEDKVGKGVADDETGELKGMSL